LGGESRKNDNKRGRRKIRHQTSLDGLLLKHLVVVARKRRYKQQPYVESANNKRGGGSYFEVQRGGGASNFVVGLGEKGDVTESKSGVNVTTENLPLNGSSDGLPTTYGQGKGYGGGTAGRTGGIDFHDCDLSRMLENNNVLCKKRN